MATFLSDPQPGDGTWLVNKNTPDAGEARGNQTRRRRRPKNNRFFRAEDDGDSGRDGGVSTELADAGGNLDNILKNRGNRNKKGPAEKSDIPRAVLNEHSGLAVATAFTFAPALSRSDATQHLPSGSSNHTSQRPRAMNEASKTSMGRKKSLPPHLARKPASSNEKRITPAEAFATNHIEPTQNAESMSNRRKASTAARGRGNARGGRGSGNRFAAARAQIPKVDPNRWKTDWAGRNSWDSSSFHTGRASSGWGTKKKRAGQTTSPPAADWSGKLAPPPPDWDSRPGFRVDQSYQKIMDWMDEIEHQFCAVSDPRVPLDDTTAADGTTFVFCSSTLQPDKPPKDSSIQQIGEIVPHYWVPIIIGPQAPQVFWNELMQSAPAPDDPIDLEGAKPWWERFVKGEDRCLNFLKEPPGPTVIGIDPAQEDTEQALKRKHDKGSKHFADNRRRFELERLQEKVEKQRRIAEKQCKLAALDAAPTAPSNRNHIKPGFKLYVRTARAEDMDAVKDIYNYYIENTTSTPGMERRSKEQTVARYRDIRLRRMPFLVAYRPGGIVKAPRKKKNMTNHPTRDDVQLPDTIVGFASADDYADSQGMYRFTAEIEFFTKETEYMNGVASCLIDRLMLLLNPVYQDQGGYEALGDDLDGLGTSRIIKNIIVNLPFEKPERLEWMGKWLEGLLKFKEVGLLENIGTKNGKAVSLAIFQRETGAILDHGNPPSGFVPT